MNHDEKFISAVKSRAKVAADEYRYALSFATKGDPLGKTKSFIVRVDEPKHSWADKACKEHLKSIDEKLQQAGYDYYDARGSVTKYGRGQEVSRFMDTFTGFEDEVTKTLHKQFFDYYVRIALMARAGASTEEIVENEKREATSEQPHLGDEIVSQLADWTREASEAEKGLGAKGPILSFKTTENFRKDIKFAVEESSVLVKMKIPRDIRGDLESISIKFYVACFIEMLMLAWEDDPEYGQPQTRYPAASEWASEFVKYFEAYMTEYRRETEFVKVGDASDQLDLLA